jgi:hypothetical protein
MYGAAFLGVSQASTLEGEGVSIATVMMISALLENCSDGSVLCSCIRLRIAHLIMFR